MDTAKIRLPDGSMLFEDDTTTYTTTAPYSNFEIKTWATATGWESFSTPPILPKQCPCCNAPVNPKKIICEYCGVPY